MGSLRVFVEKQNQIMRRNCEIALGDLKTSVASCWGVQRNREAKLRDPFGWFVQLEKHHEAKPWDDFGRLF